ncbi:LacI family DNA-binding transcriptional regulator [Amnibacterium kyonggiense]|uniref:LacI family transcriptional regulator n=1 Tax=Amnibacterium kyonggiense TaxID=595671 RepID=A0A4V3EBB2_9MICO|nr:LacI family DNA-binding transcriptional regulator [Amnibacterium kyonggiense]TDS80344.1 LacI family transcriptional regulator [Amnibacterium kyonggiense]
MVTIQDVAKAAGVSPMTVSNVINEREHVRDSTRAKVLDAMERLDYRVNVAARNLRTGRTGTIGLAVPEIDRPYYGVLAAAIMKAAEAKSLRVVVEQTERSRENELDALTLSRNRLYDGLILSTVGLGPADADLLRVDYPIVLLGERIFAGPADHVAMPNVEGARAAVEHLIARGSRRIAIVEGDPTEDLNVSSLRNQGYREALAAAGIAFEDEWVVPIGEFSLEAGVQAVQRLAERGMAVDGIFCVTDTVATGVLRGLADHGIPVPGQVRVIGFDDVPGSAYTVPSLSSVDPDHDFMARTAVDLLVRRIEGNADKAVHRDVIGPFRVVERESSGG